MWPSEGLAGRSICHRNDRRMRPAGARLNRVNGLKMSDQMLSTDEGEIHET